MRNSKIHKRIVQIGEDHIRTRLANGGIHMSAGDFNWVVHDHFQSHEHHNRCYPAYRELFERLCPHEISTPITFSYCFLNEFAQEHAKGLVMWRMRVEDYLLGFSEVSDAVFFKLKYC